MKLLNIIKENVVFNGIYCDKICIYKNYEWCNLFNEVTGYNWKKERAKRVTKCIRFFGKEKMENYKPDSKCCVAFIKKEIK